jgi:hypothetical protein
MAELNLKKLLHEIFLRSPTNLFDEFIKECAKWYDKPAHSFTDLRNRLNKKLRGDIFEEFCVLYLLHIKKYEQVWRLENVPDEILTELSLKRRDMGIDLIAKHDNGYYAIQCKYKKHSDLRKNSVSWKSVSTFYALCLRTGKLLTSETKKGEREWKKYIVMTNCDFVRHEGEKTDKDLSICIGTFRKITKDEWILMCDVKGSTLNEALMKNDNEYINEIKPELNDESNEYINQLSKNVNLDKPSKEDLRLLRLAYYNKKTII